MMHTRDTDIADWTQQQSGSRPPPGARGLSSDLSGGIDSAVVARLCQIAAPGNVVGVIMPCHSDARDESGRADSLPTTSDSGDRADRSRAGVRPAGRRSADRVSRSCRPSRQRAAAGDDPNRSGRSANIKPRLRMSALYFVGQLAELSGRRDRQSQRADDRLLHQVRRRRRRRAADRRLLKSEVRRSRASSTCPQSIIEKPPTAGLWVGQTDEEEMGFTYTDLERYLSEGPMPCRAGPRDAHRTPCPRQRPQARALRADAGLSDRAFARQVESRSRSLIATRSVS